MIDDQEIRNLAAQLGVPESQIRRDHLLSHLIGELPLEDRVVFIGGTALHRTHLPDVRLSEDLDVHLITGKAEDLVDQLLQGVRFEFPSISVSHERGSTTLPPTFSKLTDFGGKRWSDLSIRLF